MTILRSAATLMLGVCMARGADEIYLRMKADVSSILSNGDQFTTEKGHTYPLVGYDSSQSLMQLKAGPFSFWAWKDQGELVSEAGEADAAAKYHSDLAKLGVLETHAPTPVLPGAPNAAASIGAHPNDQTAAAVIARLEDPLRKVIAEEISKAMASKGVATAVSAFPVDAASPAWQNSSVSVKAGDRLLIEVSETDEWSMGQGQCNANGYDFIPPNAGVAIFHTGTENQDWHWGALVCAVGGGNAEANDSRHEAEVGMKGELTAKYDGYLYFIANDRPDRPGRPNGYDDNSGVIHVKVTVMQPANNPAVETEVAVSPSYSAPPDKPQPVAGIPKKLAAAPEESLVDTIVRGLEGPLQSLIRQKLWLALAGKNGGVYENSFPVDAASAVWQNSGVRVKPGQHVLVQAVEGDTWDDGWGPTDASGYKIAQNDTAGVPLFHEGKPDSDWHWGALICAVGEDRSVLDDPQQEVEVGNKRGFTVDNDGYLYFLTNDNRQLPDGRNGFDDNSGIIHVKVTVTDPKNEHPIEVDDAATPGPTFVAPAAPTDAEAH